MSLPFIQSHSPLCVSKKTGCNCTEEGVLSFIGSLEIHVIGLERRAQAGGYKEMSSIFADQ
jgi:hypothetical protein